MVKRAARSLTLRRRINQGASRRSPHAAPLVRLSANVSDDMLLDFHFASAFNAILDGPLNAAPFLAVGRPPIDRQRIIAMLVESQYAADRAIRLMSHDEGSGLVALVVDVGHMTSSWFRLKSCWPPRLFVGLKECQPIIFALPPPARLRSSSLSLRFCPTV